MCQEEEKSVIKKCDLKSSDFKRFANANLIIQISSMRIDSYYRLNNIIKNFKNERNFVYIIFPPDRKSSVFYQMKIYSS